MIIGSEIIFHDELTSTNSEASLLLRKSKDIREGTVIYTEFQSAGRGQPGTIWESQKGKNLLFSIILYPSSVIPEEQFLISMAISLGICDFIDRYFKGSKIKWPNDIYINDDKIAGILIENSILGEGIENSVAGIGFNLNQESFPGNITNPVSLKNVTDTDYDINICLRQILADIDRRYKILLYDERERLVCEYNSRIYRLQRWNTYKTDDRVFTGRIKDVAFSGKLRVEEKDGSFNYYSFKEIEYII
jgi:BirA family biotin operon repressor/biotin-[acetyl-CoA-carboxylase] ligase